MTGRTEAPTLDACISFLRTAADVTGAEVDDDSCAQSATFRRAASFLEHLADRLAKSEEVREAAQKRVQSGHSQTCASLPTAFTEAGEFACSCGHKQLAALLAKLEKEK